MPAYEELLQENVELRRRVTEQESRIAQLEKIIEELRRGGKRQAAPFSKGAPKSEPKPPGRKPAERYGKRAFRPVPEKLDEKIDVGCPCIATFARAGSAWQARQASTRSIFQRSAPGRQSSFSTMASALSVDIG